MAQSTQRVGQHASADIRLDYRKGSVTCSIGTSLRRSNLGWTCCLLPLLTDDAEMQNYVRPAGTDVSRFKPLLHRLVDARISSSTSDATVNLRHQLVDPRGLSVIITTRVTASATAQQYKCCYKCCYTDSIPVVPFT